MATKYAIINWAIVAVLVCVAERVCVCEYVCVEESLLPLGAHVMSIFVAYFQRVRAAVCECARLYV